MRSRPHLAPCLLALAALAGCDRGVDTGLINRPAPTFRVADGQHTVDLAALRGRVVVLNFWATWCAPCTQELPALEALQTDLPQVALVGVSVDTDHQAYTRFIAQHALNFTTVDDTANRSNALYGSSAYPETYVIDQAGVVRRKFVGPKEWNGPEIENYLRKLAG